MRPHSQNNWPPAPHLAFCPVVLVNHPGILCHDCPQSLEPTRFQRILQNSAPSQRRARVTLPSSITPFCFHSVTNPSSCNSFIFTSIQNAQACHPLLPWYPLARCLAHQPQVSSFHAVAVSLSLLQRPRPLFSAACTLFCKSTRGMGVIDVQTFRLSGVQTLFFPSFVFIPL